MDISSINTAKLKSLLKLTEVRDAIAAELQKVEEAIASVFSGGSAPAPKATAGGKRRGRKPGRKAKVNVAAVSVDAAVAKAKPAKKAAKKGGRRGAMKDQILSILKEAGAKGASVKDISSTLGVKTQNIHVWFSTTGKTAGVKKVSPGVYRLK